MLIAYDKNNAAVQPGQVFTARGGELYEFIRAEQAPTATAFGQVRMRKVFAEDPFGNIVAPHVTVFADIAFSLTVRRLTMHRVSGSYIH